MSKRVERRSNSFTFSVDYRQLEFVDAEAFNLFLSTFFQTFQTRYKVSPKIEPWLVAYSINPERDLQIELLMMSSIPLTIDEVHESLDESLFATGLDQKLLFSVRHGAFRGTAKQ